MNLTETHKRLDRLALLTVAGGLFMNFGLAIVNAHILGMSTTIVTAVQLLITLLALAQLVIRPPRIPAAYYLLFATVIIFALISAMYRQQINARFFYDIAVIPIFTLLGSTVRELDFKWLERLLYVVLAVAVFEAILPSLYASTVNSLQYYIATRDWAAKTAASWSGDAPDIGFYVGAIRSKGGVFGIADHRVSSIFLEPLSLGYFAIVMGVTLVIRYTNSFRRLIFPLGSCMLLAMMSDTRTATMLLIVLIFLVVLFRRLPRYIGLWIPIAVLFVSGLIYSIATTSGDRELAYRLGVSFSVLNASTLSDLLFGDVNTARAGDSGLLSLIANAGFFGTIAFYYLSSGLVLNRKNMGEFPIAIIIFLVTASMFGGAIFSIKTGALLGFIAGCLSTSVLRPAPSLALNQSRPQETSHPLLIERKAVNSSMLPTD